MSSFLFRNPFLFSNHIYRLSKWWYNYDFRTFLEIKERVGNWKKPFCICFRVKREFWNRNRRCINISWKIIFQSLGFFYKTQFALEGNCLRYILRGAGSHKFWKITIFPLNNPRKITVVHARNTTSTQTIRMGQRESRLCKRKINISDSLRIPVKPLPHGRKQLEKVMD